MTAGPVVWILLWVLNGNQFSLTTTLPLYTLLLVIVVYPVLEEIVFRGALQGWLLSHNKFATRFLPGITLANIITSLVFALFHLINQSPAWAFMIFFPSLVFGWARDRFGFLTASIALHSFYNAGFFLLFK